MCNTGVYPTHVLHVYIYMCNAGVYSNHVLHVYNIYITHVSARHVIPLYFYTCNTPKSPNIYYMCSTTDNVP